MIGQHSRHQWCTIETDEVGRRYLGERPVFPYRDRPDNRLHVVTEGERLWHVAHAFFPGVPKNGALFWVIADYQPEPILDPTLPLKGGTILVVPSMTTLNAVFSSQRRRQP